MLRRMRKLFTPREHPAVTAAKRTGSTRRLHAAYRQARAERTAQLRREVGA